MYLLSFHWLLLKMSFVQIGRCDYFGFGFTTLSRKRSMQHIVNVGNIKLLSIGIIILYFRRYFIKSYFVCLFVCLFVCFFVCLFVNPICRPSWQLVDVTVLQPSIAKDP